MSLTDAQIATAAREAGFSGEALVRMVAIIFGESGGDPSAVGDETLTDSRWGPSIGLAQVRCLWSQRGTGGPRDCDRLDDPRHNLAAAYEISGGGSNFRPWSIWTSGKWRRHLSRAWAAVRGEGQVLPASTASPAGLGTPGGGIVDAVVDPIAAGVRRIVVWALLIGGGVALIAAGGWRGTGGRRPGLVAGS